MSSNNILSNPTPDNDDETEVTNNLLIDRYMPLIEDHVYAPGKSNVYINYNIIGKKLTNELIMNQLQEILKMYSKIGNRLYVNPQLGFFLYNNSSTDIEKYYH